MYVKVIILFYCFFSWLKYKILSIDSQNRILFYLQTTRETDRMIYHLYGLTRDAARGYSPLLQRSVQGGMPYPAALG